MSTYLKARLGLVIVEYVEKKEEKVGEIVLTSDLNPEFREAILISVGPGFNSMEPVTDLTVGDKVLVNHQRNTAAPGPLSRPVYRTLGQPLHDKVAGKKYYLHNQSEVVAIIVESRTEIRA
jgi:co-chaperonin GroES (HSP10)